MISSVRISDSCESYLAACREMKRRCPGQYKPINGYMCIEDFVLRNGRSYEFSPAPKEIEMGGVGRCFQNAANLALNNPRKFIYCEGFCAGVIPVEHAWCVTPDGEVVDPTWTGDFAHDYYGVAFKLQFLRDCLLANEHYGLLFNQTAIEIARAPQRLWKHAVNFTLPLT